jgi:hypothetical protein
MRRQEGTIGVRLEGHHLIGFHLNTTIIPFTGLSEMKNVTVVCCLVPATGTKKVLNLMQA